METRAFAEEKIRECVDEMVECKDLGERASMSVASSYCNKNLLTEGALHFFQSSA